MKHNDLKNLAAQTFAELSAILNNKGDDYTAGSEDRLANFKIVEQLNIAKAETGLLCRMVDKISRVTSFINAGKLSVTNESATDAIHDIIGYAVLLKALIEDKKNKAA